MNTGIFCNFFKACEPLNGNANESHEPRETRVFFTPEMDPAEPNELLGTPENGLERTNALDLEVFFYPWGRPEMNLADPNEHGGPPATRELFLTPGNGPSGPDRTTRKRGPPVKGYILFFPPDEPQVRRVPPRDEFCTFFYPWATKNVTLV